MKYPIYSMLLLCCALANADHNPDAEWSWHVQSSGADESRLVLHQRDQRFGIYDLECDLGDIVESDIVEGDVSLASPDESAASLSLVRPVSNPQGLLLISCNVGAHAQRITIIDLARKTVKPVFSATGSYSASWELQQGELWISYDEPCDGGRSVDCPDGFATTFVQYPSPE